MGFSVLGALITLALSLLAQSPLALKRIGLGSSKLDKRARAFSTYAFAFMILGVGFFLAGVPIGSGEQLAAQTADPLPTPAEESQPTAETTSAAPQSTPPLTPVTGAFGGPPPDSTTSEPLTGTTFLTSTSPLSATIAPESTLSVQGPTVTSPPTATPEPTQTPTPTQTPLPTLTPTPITGQTAVIEIGGGTIWLLRSPGGQTLVLLHNGDTVILLDRRANQAGALWQEIMTVEGIVGWIQAGFLQPDPS